MKTYFVCKSHKVVFCVGEVETDDQVLRHHRASAHEILLAISRFIYLHPDCDTTWMSQNKLLEMDLLGFRRVDSKLGIPFKGPDYMTTDEATEAMKAHENE